MSSTISTAMPFMDEDDTADDTAVNSGLAEEEDDEEEGPLWDADRAYDIDDGLEEDEEEEE